MRRLVLAGATIALLLAGCGTEPGTSAGGATSTATRATSNSVSATPRPSVVNQLANGATTHTATSGDATISIRYWSTLPMNQWTAATASKPVSLSITATGTRVPTYVAAFTATYTPTGGTASPIYSDTAATAPGYAVRTPMSYQPVLTIPAMAGKPAGVTLQVQLKLITGANRAYYSRSDVVDTLTIALAN